MTAAPHFEFALASASLGAPASGCPVCRCGEVVHDEVFDGAVLHLAECRRCAHRWTSRTGPGPEASARPVMRPRRVASRPAGRAVRGATNAA